MPLLSVPIVFPHLCFSAITVIGIHPALFLLLPSFGAVIYYSLHPPIDSHFDYRFNFDFHPCGSLHLGLANSLLVLSLYVPERATLLPFFVT